jgi:hypothetical protein
MATFNRYSVTFADDELSSSLGYVFMVRPDLNLFETGMKSLKEQCRDDPVLSYVYGTDYELLYNLTQDTDGTYNHHFIPFLLDRVEEYQIPDLDITTHEMVQPFTGFTTVYAGNSNAYLSKSQFSISFRESATLRVTKLFQSWISYINGITLNLYSPRETYARSKYVNATQVIDYATSIYFLRTRPDGEIVFFHKTTGAFPTQVPISQQSYNRGGQADTRVQIQFVGGFPEAMSVMNMGEFNFNSLGFWPDDGTTVSTVPDYDPKGLYGGSFTGNIFTGSPVIIKYRVSSSHFKFYLGWLDSVEKPAEAPRLSMPSRLKADFANKPSYAP